MQFSDACNFAFDLKIASNVFFKNSSYPKIFDSVSFRAFKSFWARKLKPFFVKARQSLQNHLNPKLVIGSLLENGFAATLRLKTNVLNL